MYSGEDSTCGGWFFKVWGRGGLLLEMWSALAAGWVACVVFMGRLGGWVSAQHFLVKRLVSFYE